MNKPLFFAFFQQAFKDAQTEDEKEGVQVALQCLAKVYKYSEDEGKHSAYKLPVSIGDVFNTGCKQMCPESFAAFHALEQTGGADQSARESFEDSDQFKKFLQTVTAKGFFGDFQPNSDGYKARYAKVVDKYKQRFGNQSGDSAKAKETSNIKEADDFKSKGNEFLKSGKTEEAVESYSKAIELCPAGENTHIYYCNRAAALIKLGRNNEATKDCASSVAIKPDYCKAHSRLAQAYLNLGNKEGAVKSAQRALEIEPNNESAKSILSAAGGAVQSNPSTMSGGMPGGMPGMDGIMGEMMKNPDLMNQMNDLKSSMAGGGGMPDMSSIMSNPAFMQMAQGMMQNPAMVQMAQSMAQDPNAMANMMGAMGGGGGGMPNMADMMSTMGGMNMGDDSGDSSTKEEEKK